MYLGGRVLGLGLREGSACGFTGPAVPPPVPRPPSVIPTFLTDTTFLYSDQPIHVFEDPHPAFTELLAPRTPLLLSGSQMTP